MLYQSIPGIIHTLTSTAEEEEGEPDAEEDTLMQDATSATPANPPQPPQETAIKIFLGSVKGNDENQTLYTLERWQSIRIGTRAQGSC